MAGTSLLVPAPPHPDRLELPGGRIQTSQPSTSVIDVLGDVAVNFGRRRDARIGEPLPGTPEGLPEHHAGPAGHGFHVQVEAETLGERQVAPIGPGLERHYDFFRIDRFKVRPRHRDRRRKTGFQDSDDIVRQIDGRFVAPGLAPGNRAPCRGFER